MNKLLLKECIKFAQLYNVKIKFCKKLNTFMDSAYWKREIRINKQRYKIESETYFLFIFFHELCHILSFDYNKYKSYYTQTNRKLVRKIGLKAEIYCDKMSLKWLRSFWPDFPAYKHYKDKELQNWYRLNYRDKYFYV